MARLAQHQKARQTAEIPRNTNFHGAGASVCDVLVVRVATDPMAALSGDRALAKTNAGASLDTKLTEAGIARLRRMPVI